MVSFNKLLVVSISALATIAQSNGDATTSVVVATVATASGSSAPSQTGSSEPTELEKCAQKNSCNVEDLACKALCTGVPNPSKSQIGDTTSCVAACNQTNIEEYKTCSTNCINKYYRKVDLPDQAKNSTNSTNAKNATNGTNSGALYSTSQSNFVGAILASAMLFSYYQL
ncbi:hypothetical protein K502DRAFT_366014 [Neoconidiobolus thromboides FSU 785]|nr:hypothetical protein K502DRAFT_366014 [Neoconidiobolus thromboides FSU 785]